MNAVDTNVFVYRLDRSEANKRAVAKRLLRDLTAAGETVLLWQTLGELLNQLASWRRRGLLAADDVSRVAAAVRKLFPLVLPAEGSIDRALRYATDHSLSHWDSMMVASCAEAGVDVLYTEDMGAPRKIDVVQLVNPF
jgi:predicted nucleic acid-binding protein